MSPLATALSPAENSPAENNVPVVPLFVETLFMKQPLIVAVPLMVNAAAEDVALLPALAAANDGATRVALE